VIQTLGRSGLPRAIDAAVDALASGSGEVYDRARSEFIRDGSHARRVQYFAQLSSSENAPRREIGFAILLNLGAARRLRPSTRALIDETLRSAWPDASRAASLLLAIGRTRSKGHDAYVRAHLGEESETLREAARFAAAELGLDAESDSSSGPRVEELEFEVVRERIAAIPGDAKLGAAFFEKLGCVKCHTRAKNEEPKGPFLGGISARYKRAELVESVLRPSALVAQGFATQWFQLADGTIRDGFVVRESGDAVLLRDAQGASLEIATKSISDRGTSDGSVMPEGLVNRLTLDELASLIAYLESLE
jgi:putative heme-binding domain-containing protein